MYFWIAVACWIKSGFVLGYFYSVRLKKSYMTLEDIFLSMFIGPLNIIGIYLHCRHNVVIHTVTTTKRTLSNKEHAEEALLQLKETHRGFVDKLTAGIDKKWDPATFTNARETVEMEFSKCISNGFNEKVKGKMVKLRQMFIEREVHPLMKQRGLFNQIDAFQIKKRINEDYNAAIIEVRQ